MTQFVLKKYRRILRPRGANFFAKVSTISFTKYLCDLSTKVTVEKYQMNYR